jgi:hypothetical protein
MGEYQHNPEDCPPSRTERESNAIVLCGGEEMQNDEAETACDQVMMVGMVSCRLRSEVHVNGQRVTNTIQGRVVDGQEKTDADSEARPKRAKNWTIEGREVVDPSYSTLAGGGKRGSMETLPGSRQIWAPYLSDADKKHAGPEGEPTRGSIMHARGPDLLNTCMRHAGPGGGSTQRGGMQA